MIKKEKILGILNHYNLKDVAIGMIASHSALDLSDGATDEGLKTVLVCRRGREKTYSRYKRIVHERIILDEFKDIIQEDIQSKLREMNTIFVPNRSLTAYTSMDDVEDKIQVPFFGNRGILRADERDLQYALFKEAGVLYPKRFEEYTDIDTLAIVKISEAKRKIERAFFTCSSPREYEKKVKDRIKRGIISEVDLKDAWIEEFIVGALFNFNFFYSPIKEELEFLGLDRRIQTDIDGVLRLTAQQQLEYPIPTQNIEVGHESVTIRESILERVYDTGEKFVRATKKMYPPGIIGPFALQGAVNKDLEIALFDFSPRMPGSPVLYSSPYSKYYFGFPVTSGRRVAMEIKSAIEVDKLEKIIT